MSRGPGAQPDLRKLRYFVAVADELHFGRAAARLFITQPVLSRQIRLLEQELGAELLARTSRRVELTEAGAQLLGEARSLLAAADAAHRRMLRFAGGPPSLTVGFFVGDHLTPALNAFVGARPNVTVNLHRIYWRDQVDVLHRGKADVAFVHLPIDERGLELWPVRREPRLVVLPESHPAAAKAETAIADFAEDPVILQRGASSAWQAFHNVDPRPDGRHPLPGPEVDNIEEKLELVAAGRAISFLPGSAAATYLKAGVVYRPVVDIPPIDVCLAWAADRGPALIEAFVAAVKATTPTRATADAGASRTAPAGSSPVATEGVSFPL